MLQSLVRSPAVASVAAIASAFPKTAEDVTAYAESATAVAKAHVAEIEAAGADVKDFASARRIDLASAEFSARAAIVSVVKSVSVEKAVRDAATEALMKLQNEGIDLFTSNRNLYKILKATPAFEVPAGAHAAAADAQRNYWLEDRIADMERDGHALLDDKFQEVVALKKELAALSTKFSTNINEDNTTLVFTPEELVGTPESTLKALKPAADSSHVDKEAAAAKGESALAVGLDYPTYFAVMRNCTVASTRAQLGRAFVRRAYPQNEAIMAEVIEKRHKLAQALGFSTYATLDLASKMAKTPATAQQFVDELVPGLQKKWAKETDMLKADLPESVELVGDAGLFKEYDVNFLMNQYKIKHLSVDEVKIQEYFPMDNTINVLLGIYEKFFDVEFTYHKSVEEGGSDLGLWHESVSVVECRDRRNNGELLGHIVLDLFPRDGKFSHACCYGAVPAVLQDDGKTFTPTLAVVLANFPKATEDRPSLLPHGDAQTFFHEFGHAMHGLLGRSAMATLGGTRVKRDFVELPSQILEEWLWQPSIIKMVTKHYKSGEPLPDDLMEKKINSRNAFRGYLSLRQLQFATVSLQLFGEPLEAGLTPDTFFQTKVQKRIVPGLTFDPEARFISSFGHLMGYAATYYGYMWSEVFAMDVFDAIVERNGLLDGKVGREYARCILEVGGARDPVDMLAEFLGRPANNKAFLKELGITA